MRQRIMLDPHTGDIVTVEGPEVIAGKTVAFSPSRELPRSFANWNRHKACMVAAPALADLVEELRGYVTPYLGNEPVSAREAHSMCAAIAEAFDRPEVVALLDDIKTE